MLEFPKIADKNPLKWILVRKIVITINVNTYNTANSDITKVNIPSYLPL